MRCRKKLLTWKHIALLNVEFYFRKMYYSLQQLRKLIKFYLIKYSSRISGFVILLQVFNTSDTVRFFWTATKNFYRNRLLVSRRYWSRSPQLRIHACVKFRHKTLEHVYLRIRSRLSTTACLQSNTANVITLMNNVTNNTIGVVHRLELETSQTELTRATFSVSNCSSVSNFSTSIIIVIELQYTV